MDNLAAHTDAGVCAATGAAYDSLMPLPAYSPDRNGDLQTLAKPTVGLRKPGARIRDTL